MRNLTLALAVVATLVVAGEVCAVTVWIDVTPANIDRQPLAFTVKAKDVKDGKEFEVTVKPKAGTLPPARFFGPRFNALRDDPKITEPTVKRVDREGESVVFSFRISQKDLEGAKFSLWQMSYVEMKDEAGTTKLVPIPSATVFTFCLSDFTRKPALEASVRVKAVYFVGKQGGELSADDLKKHPEVKIVQSFADLQCLAGKKVPIWIDVTALPVLNGDKEQEWIIRKAIEGYPFAMVGCNEPLKSFRDMLDCFLISGPGPIDWTKYDTSPGFSVIMRKREKVGKELQVSGPMQGYKTAPTVQKILKITDALMAGKEAPDAP
jgi:hypothetical protein